VAFCLLVSFLPSFLPSFPGCAVTLAAILSSPLAAQTDSIITKGPYEWANGCGQMRVTLTLDTKPAGLSGLFKWDYEVQNVSLLGPLGPDRCGSINGIVTFGVGMGAETADVGNLYFSGASPPPVLWSYVSPPDLPYLVYEGYAGFGWPWGPGSICLSPVAVVAPGQTVHFGFTTKPRVVLSCENCGAAGYGAGYLLGGSFVRPLAPLGELACNTGVISDGGLAFGLRGLGGLLPALAAAGRLGVAFDAGFPNSCDSNWLEGTLAYPGPQVRLKSFKWNAVDSGTWVSLEALWKTNDNWQDDKLADEGSVKVAHPKWADSDKDGDPERSDPIAYAGPATPALQEVILKTDDPETMDAVVRVTGADSSGVGVPALVFPDVQAHFSSGKATIDSITSQQALPKKIQNLDVTLTWSISLDDGQTFSDFATTQHKLFVTMGRPRGFDGADGLPPRPHITAARLNKVTADLNGMTTRRDATVSQGSKTLETFQFGQDDLWDPLPGSPAVLYQNPWALLDQPQPRYLDCISLALLTAVQIRQVGINADISRAWATTDGFASAEETKPIGSYSAELRYGDGATYNLYEGFVFTRKQGVPAEAYTVIPQAGPLAPQAEGTAVGLPSDPGMRLDFAVIYQTLRKLWTPEGTAGRQYWTLDSPVMPLEGPVPFPLPLP
jgi:hypothetical protein